MRRLLLTSLAAVCTACASAPPRSISLLPRPERLTATGDAFRLRPQSQVVLAPAGAELQALLDPVLVPLRAASGYALPVVAEASAPHPLVVRLDAGPASEAYRLVVDADSAVLRATSAAGLARGLQSLRQLLPVAYERAVQRASAASWGVAPLPALPLREVVLPGVVIEDAPRFPYRGLHLDVGRHFFPVSFVKEYIDLLAMHRLNTFHWHLTEDQGWRIEIERYPLLTEVGGCRKETMVAKNFRPYVGDGQRYCGWYTQDEVREVVAYAAARGITVIPEIEMPGHASAAIAAYPELSCEPGPFEVITTWGVFEPVFCPAEHTFRFLENVLDEVLPLFPGTYVHIGGDEAPKNLWKKNVVAQGVRQREGLANEEELQSYFIRRMETYLASKGRKLLGWDEILEGGLPPAATVMSWRGTKGGIEAAKQGHDVVMTPVTHLYFDYYQGDPKTEPLAIGGNSRLEHVYTFEPVPAELTPEEAKHVLGAQANLWTEYIATREHAEYMAYPRVAALAEVVWTQSSQREYADFERRLGEQYRRYDMLGINYRIPDVKGLPEAASVTRRELVLELSSPHPDAVIHYTLDGSEPNAASPRYRKPLTVAVPVAGIAIRVRSVLPNGRWSGVQQLQVGTP